MASMASAERAGSSPKLADLPLLLSPALARRSNSGAGMGSEEEQLLQHQDAPASPGSPPPPAAMSWRVYRTVVLLSLTTMFVFADQNLMARAQRVSASARRALTPPGVAWTR
jgi:hypothetical protein